MIRPSLWAAIAALVVASPSVVPAQARSAPATVASRTDSAIARLFALVRREYSGDSALATVAFVERYFRHPGNAGFDASIERVRQILERAGYIDERSAPPSARLVYRIERRPMSQPTWEPEDASLRIVGQDSALLRWATNRNMLSIYSFATPGEGVEAELVDAGKGTAAELDAAHVAGKIVMAERGIGGLFTDAVQRRGAVGVLSYAMPAYTQPETNVTAIQFGRIPLDTVRRAWGIHLSYAAHRALKSALAARTPVRVHVTTRAEVRPSTELTLVAEVRGSHEPAERYVFSAHVQEPGANDNASGVAAQAEMARVAATLLQRDAIDPARTITFLWGQEITSTQRYLQEDTARARRVRWGTSLDMVGENTAVTGGTFLIEKMPDPSAVWTRGDDRHSEWGGDPLPKERITPHYFNDFILARALDQAAATGWVVRTNPFEGGSDHVPFLTAGRPGVLLWHFTDQFYHTDLDRLDKVSPREMANVGTMALVSALTLTSASELTARALVAEVLRAAAGRLERERALSADTLRKGGSLATETDILATWTRYYVDAIGSMTDIEVGGPSPRTRAAIAAAQERVRAVGAAACRSIGGRCD